MGFIYEKGIETNKTAQQKIGKLLSECRIRTLHEVGFTNAQIVDLTGFSESTVRKVSNDYDEALKKKTE